MNIGTNKNDADYEVCECYKKRYIPPSSVIPNKGGYWESRCYGTKECDLCSCGGDPSKCDFYKDIRKKANKTMNTLDMMELAKNNDKTYISDISNLSNMRYNVNLGFHDKDGKPWEGYAFKTLNNLFYINTWEELSNSVMTLEEAETKFHIKIVG